MLNLIIRRSICIAALLAVFASAEHARAAERPAHTVMTVAEMCGGCVKKITKRFEGAKGIAALKCDVESKSVTVVPAKGYVLSPRGLWEAMDEIGKTPTKLVGPSGTFTSKPKE